MDITKIRERLMELEDTIIRGLCNRANYKQNVIIYQHKCEEITYKNSYQGSYLDFMFRNIENIHSISGRYEAFDERPYYKGLDNSLVIRNYNDNISKELVEFSKKINFSPWIKIAYSNFINELCIEGDDKNYGDSVLSDIFNLQAISKRIHYGILVMESKYNENKELYDKLLDNNDDIAIINALKNVEVEEKILNRIMEKTSKIGFHKPEIIVRFFKNIIIPMTIQIELEYIWKKKL